jgi:PAS domain S-box-containing protein/putative nucleotidyltransferase with HDIG domain
MAVVAKKISNQSKHIIELSVNNKDITVPDEVVQKWQGIVNTMADFIHVPAALIMKVEPPFIKVFRSSKSKVNPYKVGDKEHLIDSGLYCETVIKTRDKLLVPNAIKDKDWNKNPDIKIGMISYLGFPLLWPDGEVFGTICVLDTKENGYSKAYEKLMLQFKELVEAHLGLLFDREYLKELVKECTAELRSSTERKEHLNAMLRAIRDVKQLIVVEKDRNRLLRSVCNSLVATRGYYNAWIALLDESKSLVTYAETGLGKNFTPIAKLLKSGELPPCGLKAINRSGVFVIEDPISECADCPLSARYAGQGCITIRLECDGKVYGLMTVAIPSNFAKSKEEQGLFNEITGDIAFALHNMEIEAERKGAVERLFKESERTKLLLDLYSRAIHLADKELYDYALEKAVSLTDSTIGFFHRVAEDQKTIILTTWNNEALKNCTTPYDTHYPLEKAGNWVDCVRQKRPVIYNGFPNSPNQKGLPKGHTPINRFMSIPVMKGEKVRFVFGVGNKPVDYEECDVNQLQLIANELNKIIMHRSDEKAIKESQKKYRDLVENANEAICVAQNGFLKFSNPKAIEMTGYSKDELTSKPFIKMIYPDDQKMVLEHYLKRLKGEKVPSIYSCRILDKEGKIIWLEVNTVTISWEGSLATLNFLSDITDRKRAEEDLQQSLKKLQKSLESTASSLASAVEIKDPYTAGHQQRVTELACAIATDIGLTNDQVEGVRITGSLHDIGKISVPSEILSKPGRLADIEFNLIKNHPQTGYELLKDIEFPWPVAQIVLQHHERMDGSGYPQGLKGEEILLEARILAVADVVEAMASHRPYRAALGIEAALVEISKNKGILYDHKVVDACIKLFTEKGFKFK